MFSHCALSYPIEASFFQLFKDGLEYAQVAVTMADIFSRMSMYADEMIDN